MTREEQIIGQASKESEIFYKMNNNYGDCFHGGFIDGAKWADEHPKDGLISIDKVDKYLKEHIVLYARTTTLDQQKEWFNNFRKAMEE